MCLTVHFVFCQVQLALHQISIRNTITFESDEVCKTEKMWSAFTQTKSSGM
jgi:hypothetical protein